MGLGARPGSLPAGRAERSTDPAGAGTSGAAPWCTIGKANATLVAGDTVLIAAGTYGDQIRPVNDGSSDTSRITYRALGDGNVILTAVGWPVQAQTRLADFLPKGTVLITGSVRAPDAPPGMRVTRAYNSIYVIDHDGNVQSVYDKLNLVPFGEFLPFQDLLEKIGLEQLTRLQGGFIEGTRRRMLEIPGAPRALPLICYEIIFPGDIVNRNERPSWIINLTNDGWFGISTGPYQHLQQARLRAIEQGLPVVRAANTGISAVIDPMGRIVARLGLGVEGVLDSSLPVAIAPTIYARSGDIPTAMMVAAALILVIRRRVAKRSRL